MEEQMETTDPVVEESGGPASGPEEPDAEAPPEGGTGPRGRHFRGWRA